MRPTQQATPTPLDRIAAIAADVALHGFRPLANELLDAVGEARNDGKELWREHAKQADEECHALRAIGLELLEALRDLLAERYALEEPAQFDASGNWTSDSPASVKARAAIALAQGKV